MVGDAAVEIRACAVQRQGEAATPFVYQKTLGPQDVLVRITHRSITRGDIQFIDNDWGDTRFPLVPGHEMIGTVEQTGRAVTGLTRGERVGVGFQLGACFECSFCRQGVEQFCPKQTVVGVNAYGGLGDQIVVDSRFAFRLPSGLASAPATPLMSSGLTVFSAITHAQLPAEARVAVLGIGGLGRVALRFLRAMEHRTSAFSRSPEKGDMIRNLGAEYVDGADATALGAHHGAFDLVLSTLNVPFDLDPYLKMLRPEGRFCFLATPLKPLSLRAGMLYDYARRCICGSYVGSRSDTVRMLAFAAEHDVLPSVEVMPFSQVNEAIGRIRRRETDTALILESLDER